jgi:hypothetical protein
MLYFIKNLFRRKPYTILGRGGISFADGTKNLYVETNNFLEGSCEIQIFYKDIRVINSDEVLSETEKKQIAITLKSLLEKDGTKSEILPI